MRVTPPQVSGSTSCGGSANAGPGTARAVAATVEMTRALLSMVISFREDGADQAAAYAGCAATAVVRKPARRCAATKHVIVSGAKASASRTGLSDSESTWLAKMATNVATGAHQPTQPARASPAKTTISASVPSSSGATTSQNIADSCLNAASSATIRATSR